MAGCELICMLNAYQGYHQVSIAREDQEKVSFVTADGTFCYKVYVDDILIKSLRSADLCADVEETCQTLRTYGIKLNPTKCLFGAKSRRFLGYIVTERGIEANPGKVKAIQDMPPPRNLKEVQRLTGRITTLSRFISRSSDRSLSFFKILRRATKFQWDSECDQAFEELKQYLSSLPILAKPTFEEPLWIYLSSTEYAIGSALVKQEGGEQQLVYFLSHILKDTESRYTGLEKLAYALILAARRLRPYFLAHTIIVMTNIAFGRVMLNPEASSRLIKWITELSEFDIQYQPRSAIKAQALVDFVAEVQNPEPESLWKVYVDGSSARQGSGIGILLISPREDRVQLSIRLDHWTTNNEAEYEALIAGLQAARHVGATKAFERLKANFQEVTVRKIPRSENQIANELAKLASALTPIVTNCPIEQVSLVAHVDRAGGIPFLEDWRTPIVKFLQSRALTGNHDADRSLRSRAASKDNREYGQEVHIANIIYRFGIPHRLVLDNGRQFTGQELKEWCEGYGVQQAFTSVVYLQSNGQAEVINREILIILHVRLDHMGGSWVDEMPSELWALRTTPKEGTGVTPFHLVYDGEAVVPVEIGVESDRVLHYDEGNEEWRMMELDMVDEVRDKTAARLTAYRQRMR
ncbi:uncharacterized protein LOC122055144 [Zingiber officinale]|uniref:uncharacterized protein LOC122055144 n=1 Tax=Zingiber officinale TaxID=94328 RepID=UPI001C4CD664|nr:uncharacterized protein LOC122055144 [Zingiber officinale]